MPPQENLKAQKKKTGRKPTKIEPFIVDAPLRWPSGIPRTAASERVRGDFRLKSSKHGVTMLASIKTRIVKFFKHVNIHHAQVTFAFRTAEEAVDPEFHEPGVVIWYRWKGQDELKLACDAFSTAIANFGACLETLDGFHKANKHKVHHDFQVAFERFGLVKVQPTKMKSKAHFDSVTDWPEILEIDEQDIDAFTGLPKDQMLVGRRRRELARYYYPQLETAPNEESWHVITDAVNFLKEAYQRTAENREQRDLEIQREAQKRYEERRKKHTAPEAAVKTSEKPVEPVSEVAPPPESKKPTEVEPEPTKPALDADENDDSEASEPGEENRKSEPSEDELKTIEDESEPDVDDNDLDDSEDQSDEDEEFHQRSPTNDQILFDSPDSDGDTDDDEDLEDNDVRSDLKKRRRKLLDQDADDEAQEAV